MDDQVIICRCEDLTLADIRAVIGRGHLSLEEIKRLTRCGMGPCQGKTCRGLVLKELTRAAEKAARDIAITTFRPPVKPVQLKCFTAVGHNEE